MGQQGPNEKLFEYFIRETNLSLVRLETKIDGLQQFKWTTIGKIAGASLVVSFITSLGVGLATIYFGSH